ncbi:MAG TPA: hypothetical protein VK470_12290 [Bacteroidota bacterium]|nr:hypothetical protein [Bacteroidota bacterium]
MSVDFCQDVSEPVIVRDHFGNFTYCVEMEKGQRSTTTGGVTVEGCCIVSQSEARDTFDM